MNEIIKNLSLIKQRIENACLKSQRNPNEASKQQSLNICYNGNIHELKKIPLETGVVYFIRFIRNDLKLKLITESLMLMSF
jgi:hypothetical protein